MSFQKQNVRGFFAALSRAFAFLRAMLGNAVVLLVLLLILAPAFVLVGSKGVEVPDGGALAFTPEHIGEQPGRPEFSPFSGLSAPRESLTVGDVVAALEAAGGDERIATLTMDMSKLKSISNANIEAIGAAIGRFRAAGKAVIAFADNFTQNQYHLASFADEVHLHPFGTIEFDGALLHRSYFGGLLTKLKANVHVFQMGQYKSAAEPYERSDMSPAAREANQALVDGLWDEYVTQVAANRDLTPAALHRYAREYDQLLVAANGDTARVALEHGLVDELITADAWRERLIGEVGGDGLGGYLHTTVSDYAELGAQSHAKGGGLIAVVVAEGTILEGDQPRGRIGGESTSALIRKARTDEDVKAIVLRVDSGGGSAFASEQIREELELAQTAGKPVVASMGGVAASGGYWISATADEIWAAPTTLTGSIGVIGLAVTLEETMAEVGVATDGVDTGAVLADLARGRGMTERYGNVVTAYMEFVYRRFVNLVARGRDMPVEDVDAIAQGRVWTGRQAFERGLVDGLGDRDAAVAAAARLAGLDEYRVETFETDLSPQDELLTMLADNLSWTAMPGGGHLDRLLAAARLVSDLSDPRDVYAICEVCLAF